MTMKKVKLLRPLDGHQIGDTVSFKEEDAKRLAARHVVQILGDADDEPKEEKMAQAPENKMAQAPQNKSAGAKTKAK